MCCECHERRIESLGLSPAPAVASGWGCRRRPGGALGGLPGVYPLPGAQAHEEFSTICILPTSSKTFPRTQLLPETSAT